MLSYPLEYFLSDSLTTLLIAVLLPLLIPMLIIVTRRRAGGAIVACAAAALACLGALALGLVISYAGIVRDGDPWPVPPLLLYSAGSLAAFAGWTLALFDAVSRQQGQWPSSLTLTSMVSWIALALVGSPCLISGLVRPGQVCSPLHPALINAGSVLGLVGPAVSLAYGLRVYRHAQHMPLSPSSSSDAALAGEHGEDADAELEIRAEKL
jgi:hypothetical protein